MYELSIFVEVFKWTGLFTMRTMAFGMNSVEVSDPTVQDDAPEIVLKGSVTTPAGMTGNFVVTLSADFPVTIPMTKNIPGTFLDFPGDKPTGTVYKWTAQKGSREWRFKPFRYENQSGG